MANYSRLGKHRNDWRTLDSRVDRLVDVILSDQTIAKRSAIRQGFDDFCTFSWNGVNAFDTFGAFITNKSDLKFYNGPSYSNTYTTPMFTDAAQNLVGIKFNTQKISFTIAVYWISEEHYRHLMYWLNPYEIGALVFDFQPMWNYTVKLAGCKDSTRTLLGYENSRKEFNPKTPETPTVINEKVPMYYTEITLDFELQGEPCAKYNIPYDFYHANTLDAGRTVPELERSIWELQIPSSDIATDSSKLVYKTFLPKIASNTTGNIKSDLSTGMTVLVPLLLKLRDDLNETYTIAEIENFKDSLLNIKLEACYNNNSIDLYELELKNLSYVFDDTSSPDASTLYLTFNSKDGLLFLRFGDGEDKLLTQLQTLANGERIVASNRANQFAMPGTFEYPNFDFNDFYLKLTLSGDILNIVDTDEFLINEDNADTIQMYAATNLI